MSIVRATHSGRLRIFRLKLRSVQSTAALSDNSMRRVVDATAARCSEEEIQAIWRTASWCWTMHAKLSGKAGLAMNPIPHRGRETARGAVFCSFSGLRCMLAVALGQQVVPQFQVTPEGIDRSEIVVGQLRADDRPVTAVVRDQGRGQADRG